MIPILSYQHSLNQLEYNIRSSSSSSSSRYGVHSYYYFLYYLIYIFTFSFQPWKSQKAEQKFVNSKLIPNPRGGNSHLPPLLHFVLRIFLFTIYNIFSRDIYSKYVQILIQIFLERKKLSIFNQHSTHSIQLGTAGTTHYLYLRRRH